MFIAAPFTIARTQKQLKCPLTDECIKMWYIYIPSHKKNKIMPLAATWISQQFITLCAVNQAGKDKYMISLICNLIFEYWYKWTYLQNRNRLKQISKTNMITNGETQRGVINQEYVYEHIHTTIHRINNQQGLTV